MTTLQHLEAMIGYFNTRFGGNLSIIDACGDKFSLLYGNPDFIIVEGRSVHELCDYVQAFIELRAARPYSATGGAA